ncbi:hypothetical protein DRW03_02260 [Corallococcus sp. H22C18031201]|uniref:GNAT family N-acetyltransferase n=1 Tax=Citreicoccus inhibens TaxID=2849499 RepID=UPI000ED04325|nr:GNAT family N-acetyltransferase [Citreicoccus inhibens]MBU8895069.1 GNAT family N-acetyltransferase [Citreicoccus inhibens]RJS27218.1 hypothetical protein DRW03_02260 [Corallococcus sp. H22C18031201]
MQLRVDKVETVEGLHALRSDWQRLAQAHGGGVPFTTWEWNATWWAHFRERRVSVRDGLFVLALRDASGALVAVAPLMRTERPGMGPLRARVLQFFGADPNVTELRGIVRDPAHEREVYAALADYLREHADEWDWMMWSGLRMDGDAARELAALAPLSATREVPMFTLPLEGNWEAFKSTRSRNIKESLRKCYNSLKRDGHAFTFDVARERNEVAHALDTLLRLHRARSTATDTVQHRDVFDSVQASGFLKELCDRLSTQDRVRVFQLRIAGEVVAARVGFVLGSTLYLYYSGYDPRWGDYSVMTTTVAESLKYAFAEGFQVANLSTGRDVSKTRWSPDETVYHEALQLSPARRGQMAFATYRRVREMLDDERVQGWARRFLARRAGT